MITVGVFFADGFEEIEALTVVDLLRRVEIQTEMISVTGNKQVTGSHGISVMMDHLIEEANVQNLDMIVLPGGMPGTTNLEKSELLMEQLDLFYHAQKQISAICAAPTILGHRGFLKGRVACCYPGRETELEGAHISMNPVEVSDFIITGRGAGTAIEFVLAIIEHYKGKERAEKLASAIIYQ